MMTRNYSRLIALFAALALVISLGACKNSSDTMDSNEPATTDPSGGGPDDNLSGATEGSGTTTSDPSTEPSTNEPIDDTVDPAGGGPEDLDTPDNNEPGNLQPGADPAQDGTLIEEDSETDIIYEEPTDDSVRDPAGGGPTDESQDESQEDLDNDLPNEQFYDSDNSNEPGSGS